MRAVILLSAGLHPVSGRPAPVTVEAQATRLALALGAGITGLHAGEDEAAVRDHLGHGLPEITLLSIPADADPLPALMDALRASPPDLVLAGRRGAGGSDTGLLPYRLAQALAWPIVSDAAGLARDGASLAVEQALPRGARRRVRVRLPCVVTVHPAAPAPLTYAYAAARQGRVIHGPGVAAAVALPEVEERPYRRRPRLIGPAAEGGEGKVLVNPAPEVAAAEVLTFLRRVGVGAAERKRS